MPAQTLIHQQHANAKRNACANYKWQGNCGEPDWENYANTIFGLSASDRSGTSLALSPNGKHLAVGVSGADGTRGQVWTYRLKDGLWSATGIITGSVPAVGDFIGTSVDISDGGTRVIFGAPYSDSNKGYAEVYEFNGNTWNQLGNKLYGVNQAIILPKTGDYSGYAVAISGDGTRIAVSAPWAVLIPAFESGAIVTYEWTGVAWITYGSTMIRGPFFNSAFGYSIDLSTNGSKILFGIPSLSTPSSTTSSTPGYVQLWDASSGIWTQEINELGSVANGAFGYSVSINYSGNTITGGAPYATINGITNAGYVSVYRKNTSNVWNQYGTDIIGLQTSAKTGSSVSLSSDGNRIAVAYPVRTLAQPVNGFARTFHYRNNDWFQYGSDIENNPLQNNSDLRSLAISGDGYFLVTGRPLYDSQGVTESGEVNTYRLETTSEARCCPAVPIRRSIKC